MAMILALPEEQFTILGPIFLDELEKSFSNVQDKIFIAQAVNAAGQKVEDIQQVFIELIDSIDD
jgi:phage-related protein